jgi:TetR/AcrR family fatty acid metabolism transcriptional regulator
MPRVSPEAKVRLEGARRSQILAAAALVFARKGFDRATIADVAQAAGLAEGSIYNYFRSKDELLAHIPRQIAQPVLARFLERTPSPATVEEMEALLLQLSAAIVDRVRTHARFLKVFFSALPYLSPAGRKTYMQLLPIHATSALERMLRDGVRAGYLRKDLNSVIAARVLPGMLFFFLMVQEVLVGRRLVPYDYDVIVPEVVRVFLHGTAARPRAARSPARLRAQGRHRST